MDNVNDIADEISILFLCALAALFVGGSPFIIAGFLAAVVLVCVCWLAKAPAAHAAQWLFCVAAMLFHPLTCFLPVVAYLSMHERAWTLRLPWLASLGVTACASLAFAFNGGSGFLGAALSDLAAPAVQLVVVAVLCAIATVLAVRDVRESSERRGLRFACDDLRERNIALQAKLNAAAATDNDQQSHEAEVFSDLTERELAVVRLVAEGMDNREIAASLFLSEGTVRNHISSVLAKKQLSNRTQIAVAYYRGDA